LNRKGEYEAVELLKVGRLRPGMLTRLLKQDMPMWVVFAKLWCNEERNARTYLQLPAPFEFEWLHEVVPQYAQEHAAALQVSDCNLPGGLRLITHSEDITLVHHAFVIISH
jgi:hypothetical protein